MEQSVLNIANFYIKGQTVSRKAPHYRVKMSGLCDAKKQNFNLTSICSTQLEKKLFIMKI